VRELVAQLGEEVTLLSGRCLSYGEGITFWPLFEIFRQAGAEGELETALEATSPDQASWAVRRFFESLAEARPLVLVFDDLHWAEPGLLDLLEHLGDLSREARILLVCLARQEFLDSRPGWGGGKLNATTILLEPLNQSDSAELLENWLGSAELDESTRRRVLEAAEGNPLFVEEMAAMLAENGGSRMLDVPPTIQALLAARLDRLAPPERDIVGRASVEGKVFHRGAVLELSPQELRTDVAAHLLSLVRKELIRPSQAAIAGEDAYRFRHQLIRDAAYGSLSKRARSALHERFAAWLERAAGAHALEYEEILAWHLEQAYRYRVELGPEDARAVELGRRAAAQLDTAGRRAFARSDMRAAISLLERAHELLAEGSPARLELTPIIGEALMQVGDFDLAGHILESGRSEARIAGERRLELRILIQMMMLRMFGTANPEIDDLRAEARSAAAELEELGDDLAVARAKHIEALSHLAPGQFGMMRQALEAALDHARRAGDRREQDEILFWFLIADMYGPRPTSEAICDCRQILEQVEGRRHIEAGAYAALTLLYGYAGRIDEAREADAKRRSIYSELGMQLELAATTMTVGWMELIAGEPVRAEDELRLASETLEAMGERGYLSTVQVVLAEVLYAQGRYAEAEETSRHAETNTQVGDVTSEVGWRAVRAKALAQRGELDAAEMLAREALKKGRSSDSPTIRTDGCLALAEVLSIGGRRAEALPYLAEALQLFVGKEIEPAVNRVRAQIEAL
jgi:predicted ATPase